MKLGQLVCLVGYLKRKGLMNIFYLADSILNISCEKTKTFYWESEYSSNGGLIKKIILSTAVLLITKTSISKS